MESFSEIAIYFISLLLKQNGEFVPLSVYRIMRLEILVLL